jgi:hypothetical protein
MERNQVITDPAALSAKLATEEPAYMAKWLALELLLADETVRADADLYDRLSLLQETWESQALARHTAPVAPASGDAPER